MKLKIGLLVTSTLFLVIALFNASLTFAQETNYACIVDVKCTNLVADETNGFFSFTVSTPDAGTANRITAINMTSGYEHVRNVSLGDTVVVSYSFFYASDLVYSTETGILRYTGPADSVTINATEIPEFSSILSIPLLTIATLLVIIYRRRHTS